MLPARTINKTALLSLLVVSTLTASAVGAAAQQSKLGKVDFPTSGSEQAKAHFLRGVAALHSFWFEEALDEFRESTKADPGFMMGYWGEAMAYNHPLWAEQDTEAARKVLAKISDNPKLTERERAYLNAVRVLYGEGDKLTRDIAYSAAMEKIYKAYPDDLEAASLYALSLLGTVRPGDKGFRRQMQAGAIALDVYRKNPDHPGAAHYIIHAFDDPEHAILALPAARRYSEIAPEAHHARHMPSHIFLQLGMWPEAAASNESAWAVSDAWVKRKGLSITHRDYHSLHWLLYVYLQQGRYGKAEELLGLMRRAIVESDDRRMLERAYAEMAAAFVVGTERWDAAAKIFDTSGAKPESQSMYGGVTTQPPAHCTAQRLSEARAATTTPSRSKILAIFIQGMAAATDNRVSAEKSIDELRAVRKQLVDSGEPYRAKIVGVMELEVAAASRASKGDYDEAIKLMRQATSIEEEMSPPSGPPDVIKPSHELLGEILLRAGRPKEAGHEFETALLRQPNRARSLLGAARAAAQSGDSRAALSAYSNLLRVWGGADGQLAELREARNYHEQASTR